MKKAIFEVVYRTEISASTAKKAAIVARDMMLDPEIKLHVDVYPTEYLDVIDDWVPITTRGWFVSFGAPAMAVNPLDCVEWYSEK